MDAGVWVCAPDWSISLQILHVKNQDGILQVRTCNSLHCKVQAVTFAFLFARGTSFWGTLVRSFASGKVMPVCSGVCVCVC